MSFLYMGQALVHAVTFISNISSVNILSIKFMKKYTEIQPTLMHVIIYMT